MLVTASRVMAVAVLALWILAGPVGMAFSGCAEMCEGPCGMGTPSLQGPGDVSPMPLVAIVGIPPAGDPPEAAPGILDPPPKSLLSA